MATAADRIHVELIDGHEHQIILHAKDGKPAVNLIESKDGKELRRETTSP